MPPSFLRAALHIGAAAALLTAIGLPATARASTIVTFDDMPAYTAAYSPSILTDSGLDFATGYYEAVYPAIAESNANNGTQVLVNGYSTLTITAASGGDFLFQSLDYGQSFFTNPSDLVTITLNLAGGGSETFDVTSTDNFQTFTADVMVSSVVVGNNSGYMAIDNVTFDPPTQVPEPTETALFLLGTISFALVRLVSLPGGGMKARLRAG